MGNEFRYVVVFSKGPPHAVVAGDRCVPPEQDVEVSSDITHYKIYRQEPGRRLIGVAQAPTERSRRS